MSKKDPRAGIAVFVLVLLAPFLTSCLADGGGEDSLKAELKQMGWLDEYKSGENILLKLSTLSSEEQGKFDIAAYRDSQVAFVGGAAPPGATNDLTTANGFYLRVVNPQGADLRPHGAGWSVLVRGKVLQVLPRNKIIVIEVPTKDWIVLETD